MRRLGMVGLLHIDDLSASLIPEKVFGKGEGGLHTNVSRFEWVLLAGRDYIQALFHYLIRRTY